MEPNHEIEERLLTQPINTQYSNLFLLGVLKIDRTRRMFLIMYIPAFRMTQIWKQRLEINKNQ